MLPNRSACARVFGNPVELYLFLPLTFPQTCHFIPICIWPSKTVQNHSESPRHGGRRNPNFLLLIPTVCSFSLSYKSVEISFPSTTTKVDKPYMPFTPICMSQKVPKKSKKTEGRTRDHDLVWPFPSPKSAQKEKKKGGSHVRSRPGLAISESKKRPKKAKKGRVAREITT